MTSPYVTSTALLPQRHLRILSYYKRPPCTHACLPQTQAPRSARLCGRAAAALHPSCASWASRSSRRAHHSHSSLCTGCATPWHPCARQALLQGRRRRSGPTGAPGGAGGGTGGSPPAVRPAADRAAGTRRWSLAGAAAAATYAAGTCRGLQAPTNLVWGGQPLLLLAGLVRGLLLLLLSVLCCPHDIGAGRAPASTHAAASAIARADASVTQWPRLRLLEVRPLHQLLLLLLLCGRASPGRCRTLSCHGDSGAGRQRRRLGCSCLRLGRDRITFPPQRLDLRLWPSEGGQMALGPLATPMCAAMRPQHPCTPAHPGPPGLIPTRAAILPAFPAPALPPSPAPPGPRPRLCPRAARS